MFLVILRWFHGQNDDICVVTETKEKAQEWIEKEMEGQTYSGLGVHKIVPVKFYK